MNNETDIELSGPFSAKDSSGNSRDITAIRIFDEGYGIIDVYVHMAVSMHDDRLYEDQILIGQIMARLRILGYQGPAFGHGDLGLQDDKLIVLEAPEAFNAFAEKHGWKNLAEEFADDDTASLDGQSNDGASATLLDALMHKFKTSS
jgi:hypothetical protein